jgi:hypothetical protein
MRMLNQSSLLPKYIRDHRTGDVDGWWAVGVLGPVDQRDIAVVTVPAILKYPHGNPLADMIIVAEQGSTRGPNGNGERYIHTENQCNEPNPPGALDPAALRDEMPEATENPSPS